MGSSDPNYSSPPAGWRKVKAVSFVGMCGNNSNRRGTSRKWRLVQETPGSRNLAFEYEYEREFCKPVDSVSRHRRTARRGLQRESDFYFWCLRRKFRQFIHVRLQQLFVLCWPRLERRRRRYKRHLHKQRSDQGNPKATVGADNQAAILIKPTSSSNAAVGVSITNSVTASGGIKYYEGTDTGSLCVNNAISESIAGGSAGIGTVWVTSDIASIINVSNLAVADNTGTVYALRVDGTIGLNATLAATGYFRGELRGQLALLA